MMQDTQARLLRIAFAAGVVTDALALLPMLFPALARTLWGFANQGGAYQFAMGYGASLMLIAVQSGYVTLARMVPTWCLQAVLFTLFGIGHYHPTCRRSVEREVSFLPGPCLHERREACRRAPGLSPGPGDRYE